MRQAALQERFLISMHCSLPKGIVCALGEASCDQEDQRSSSRAARDISTRPKLHKSLSAQLVACFFWLGHAVELVVLVMLHRPERGKCTFLRDELRQSGSSLFSFRL